MKRMFSCTRHDGHITFLEFELDETRDVQEQGRQELIRRIKDSQERYQQELIEDGMDILVVDQSESMADFLIGHGIFKELTE